MDEKDRERFEEYLALERYIEALRAGGVTPAPVKSTPELGRLYLMAMLFHAASSEAAAPRPEFIAALEAKLKQCTFPSRPPRSASCRCFPHLGNRR